MPAIPAMIDPGGRLLARHLKRLGETLESFGSRLRDAVASAVGETLSGIVRETLRAVLAEQPTFPASPGRYDRPPRPARPSWAEREDWEEEAVVRGPRL